MSAVDLNKHVLPLWVALGNYGTNSEKYKKLLGELDRFFAQAASSGERIGEPTEIAARVIDGIWKCMGPAGADDQGQTT